MDYFDNRVRLALYLFVICQEMWKIVFGLILIIGCSGQKTDEINQVEIFSDLHVWTTELAPSTQWGQGVQVDTMFVLVKQAFVESKFTSELAPNESIAFQRANDLIDSVRVVGLWKIIPSDREAIHFIF